MDRDGPGLGLRPIRRSSLLRHLDACQPRYEQPGPNGAHPARVFSGWYVPDWLMLRVKAALAPSPTATGEDSDA